jgi:pimeloyl-ACP methyl ester carboxylesterase
MQKKDLGPKVQIPQLPSSPRFMLCCVGGLGKTQLDKLQDAVIRKWPGIVTIDFGEQNEYARNVVMSVETLRKEWPEELPVVLVGHSFGGWKVVTSLFYLQNVAAAIAIDPVKPELGSRDQRWPECFPSSRFWWFQRGLPGIEVPMTISGLSKPPIVVPRTTHNGLPNDPEVIQEVLERISESLVSWAFSHDSATEPSKGKV